jgi:hypothetical protein
MMLHNENESIWSLKVTLHISIPQLDFFNLG